MAASVSMLSPSFLFCVLSRPSARREVFVTIGGVYAVSRLYNTRLIPGRADLTLPRGSGFDDDVDPAVSDRWIV